MFPQSPIDPTWMRARFSLSFLYSFGSITDGLICLVTRAATLSMNVARAATQ
jgi:hypothetical protein